jgi:hypothetical protein
MRQTLVRQTLMRMASLVVRGRIPAPSVGLTTAGLRKPMLSVEAPALAALRGEAFVGEARAGAGDDVAKPSQTEEMSNHEYD